MTEIIQDFLQKFHSLEGHTLDDRKRNFFALIFNYESQFRTNLDLLSAISTNLKPKTYLENLLKIDFLLYFRRTAELFEIVKQGNDAYVGKIIKHKWFFEQYFKDVDPKKLVNEVFPEMSFSVRMKILRKLSRILEKFDGIFDEVLERYGINIASRFLDGCSVEKVRSTLENYSVVLTSTQLRILYGKDPELVVFYFDNLPDSLSIYSNTFRKFIKFLSTKDFDMVITLKKKHNIVVSFGRRLTKKLVSVKKHSVITNPDQFQFLNSKALCRKLGADMVQLFINTLPKNIEELLNYNNYWRVLHLGITKKYCYNLYVRTFQTHFKINLADYPIYISETLLGMIPNNSERAALAKIKVNEGNEDYIRFLLTEESIPLIQEKLKISSYSYERRRWVGYLIETCHINKDMEALLSVLKYFNMRHRNEEYEVHYHLLWAIEQYFGYGVLTREMWEVMNELADMYKVKFGKNYITYRRSEMLPTYSFMLRYLEFLFKNDQPVDDLITDYFKMYAAFPRCDRYSTNFTRYFLLYTLKNTTEFQMSTKVIEEIYHWNCTQKSDQIVFYEYPVLLSAFKTSISNLYSYWNRYVTCKILDDMIPNCRNSSVRNECLQLYWNRFEQLKYFGHLKWFLYCEPSTVIENFDTIIKALNKHERDPPLRLQIWYIIKKYSHLHLDEKSMHLCLSIMSDNENLEMKPKFVSCLSVLMKPEDYANLADTYKPENKKLNLEDQTEVRSYTLQCAIGRNFKNTKSCEVLPSLLNYVVGDYFQDSKYSLYSILHRTPENVLPRYLNNLSKKAVSVRKHAVFLACELCSLRRAECLITQFNKMEGSLSVQKHICSATVKYFAKNPTDAFFSLVKKNIQNITKEDKESLKFMVNQWVGKIPKKFKLEYLEFTWRFLEKIIPNWEILSPLKEALFEEINQETIRKQLTLVFVEKIIKDHFMTENNEKEMCDIDAFIMDLLKEHHEKLQIFQTLLNIIEKNGTDDNIQRFFDRWFDKIIRSRNYGGLQHLEPFLEYYEQRISLVENFTNFLKIFFLRIYLRSSQVSSMEDFSDQVVGFYKGLINSYGPHVMPCFAKVLDSVLPWFIDFKNNVYDYFYYMVSKYPEVDVLVLEATSKPTYHYEWIDASYKKLIDHVKNIDSLGIKVMYSCKFEPPLEITNPFPNKENSVENEGVEKMELDYDTQEKSEDE